MRVGKHTVHTRYANHTGRVGHNDTSLKAGKPTHILAVYVYHFVF